YMWRSAKKSKPFSGWSARSMSIPRRCITWRTILNFVPYVPIRVARIFCGGWVSIRRKRLPGRKIREPKEFLLRTEAAPCLQGSDHVRGHGVAADPDCDAGFSVFRDSE